MRAVRHAASGLAWAVALAGPVTSCQAQGTTPATPRASAGVRLVPGWGVDTAATIGDYTGGNRPNPVPAVLAVWRAYLEDRPDSLHPSPHWSAAEQRALPPGAEYDLTRGFVFQGREWGREMRITVLDVVPDADSAAWTVRTLFARVGAGGAEVRPLAIVRSRVVRDGARWTLASPMPAAVRAWRRERVGRLRYLVVPGRSFDRARAERAARLVDSLSTAFAVSAPDSIAYLVAGSPDEAQRALGLDWALATPGRAFAPNRLLYSGDPALGELYAHELAHVVLAPLTPPGTSGMASEGLATWVGGSVGRDFPTLMREWGAFLRARPAVTLSGIVRGAYDFDGGWRPAWAILFAMVHERRGMRAVRAMLDDLARRPVDRDDYVASNEAHAAAAARALGLARAALDGAVRARALRYADAP